MKVIRWYPDRADRFIELLQDNSWNQAITLLKAEMAAVTLQTEIEKSGITSSR